MVEYEVRHGERTVRLQLVRFDRSRRPVAMAIGPVLHLDDVLGTKVAALATRAEPRDFIDVAAALSRYSRRELVELGAAPWAYGLTGAVALACFLLYRRQRQFVLLVAGVGAAAITVPEAVADVTNGALGGSLILLVAGVVLVAFSALGLRLRGAGGPRGHRPRSA
jgi:hypothetical protein